MYYTTNISFLVKSPIFLFNFKYRDYFSLPNFTNFIFILDSDCQSQINSPKSVKLIEEINRLNIFFSGTFRKTYLLLSIKFTLSNVVFSQLLSIVFSRRHRTERALMLCSIMQCSVTFSPKAAYIVVFIFTF